MPDTAPPIAVTAVPPPGWVDKTMIVYSAPAAPGRAMSPTIVIGRDALGRGETFREFCNRQVDTFRATLPEFTREEETTGRVGEHDAFQLRFLWRAAAGLLCQRVFFIAAPGGAVVTYAGTAAADDYPAFHQLFEDGLATVRVGPATA